jgi:hypothetical protein
MVPAIIIVGFDLSDTTGIVFVTLPIWLLRSLWVAGFICTLTVAPFVLFHKVRLAMDVAKEDKSFDQGSQLATPRLNIEQPYFVSSTQDLENRKVGLFVGEFFSGGSTVVQHMKVKVLETEMDTLNWRPFRVSPGGVNFTIEVEMKDWMDNGICTTEILAFTEHGTWKSRSFYLKV